MLDSALSVSREGANKRQVVIVRANFIKAGYCGSVQTGGKEFAKVLFDSSVHKTGWKLILSKNVGKLLMLLWKPIQVLLILNVLQVHQRSYEP